MEEYTEFLRGYLEKRRNITKNVFKIAGSIYRGVKNSRFIVEEELAHLNKKEGAN